MDLSEKSGLISVIAVILILCLAAFLSLPAPASQQVNSLERTKHDEHGTDTYPEIQAIPAPPPNESIISYSPDHANWIRLDPIPDFYLGVNGTTISFNISGTTNYPVGSIIWINSAPGVTGYYGFSHAGYIRNELTTVQANPGSNNTFAYPVSQLHFGKYYVTARKANTEVIAVEYFQVMHDVSGLQGSWIDVDPVPVHRAGDIFPITGTTNLPPGSLIEVSVQQLIHGCPVPVPESHPTPVVTPTNTGLFCYGTCQSFFSNESVPVVAGTGGINRWTTTLNSSGWCYREKFDVLARNGSGQNEIIGDGGLEFRYP